MNDARATVAFCAMFWGCQATIAYLDSPKTPPTIEIPFGFGLAMVLIAGILSAAGAYAFCTIIINAGKEKP